MGETENARPGARGSVQRVTKLALLLAAVMAFEPVVRVPGARFLDVQNRDTAAERRALEQATGVRLACFDEVDYSAYSGFRLDAAM